MRTPIYSWLQWRARQPIETCRLIEKAVKQITCHSAFKHSPQAVNLLGYLARERRILEAMASPKDREAEIAGKFFERAIKPAAHLDPGDAIVRNAIANARRVLEDAYLDGGLSSSAFLFLPAHGQNAFVLQLGQLNERYALGPMIVILLLVAICSWLSYSRLDSRRRPLEYPVRAIVGTLTPFATEAGNKLLPAVAPSGDRIAYSWDENGSTAHIWVRSIEGAALRRLTQGPTDDFSPAWSPDGRRLAFLRLSNQKGEICVISPEGGKERVVTEVFGVRWEIPGRQLEWSHDSASVVVADKDPDRQNFGLFAVDVMTGKRQLVAQAPQRSIGYSNPAYSPDGSMLAFLVAGSLNMRDLMVMPAGRVARKITLPEHTDISGLGWTPQGKTLIVSLHQRSGPRLYLVQPDGGTALPIEGFGEDAIYPSMRGQVLAYAKSSLDNDLFRANLPKGGGMIDAPQPFVASSRLEVSPQISPDGARIAFASDRTGTFQIWVQEGKDGQPFAITHLPPPGAGSPRWSVDGRRIVFDSRVGGDSQIYVVNSDGQASPAKITEGNAEHSVPSWSHDSHSIYYASNQSGSMQVWRTDIDTHRFVEMTANGGFAPFESCDGRYVYYAKDRAKRGLWRVSVDDRKEEPVIPELLPKYWPYWSLVCDGIYYLHSDSAESLSGDISTAGVPTTLKFFAFTDGAVRTAWRMTDMRGAYWPGLAVSRDGSWMVYPNVVVKHSDVFLVDNAVLKH